MRDHRMIPRLAFNGLKVRQFFVPRRIRFHQRNFSRFRKHQQQSLIRDQQHLPVAITPAFHLPFPFSRLTHVNMLPSNPYRWPSYTTMSL